MGIINNLKLSNIGVKRIEESINYHLSLILDNILMEISSIGWHILRFGTAVEKHKDGRAYFLILYPNGEETFEVKTSQEIWESIIIGERYGYTIKYNMFKEELVEMSKAYSN